MRRALPFAGTLLLINCLLAHPHAGALAQRHAAPDGADAADISQLWVAPPDVESTNLFEGRWPADFAPDAQAVFRFVRPKRRGFNPGLVVTDPAGRVWHVKQHAQNNAGAEGPVEVFLSRLLSAVGYHQPPEYFLPSFTLDGSLGTRRHTESGGRFRLDEPSLKSIGSWTWRNNPFVGTRPFKGLIVILLLFNSTDLKDSNNTLYDVTLSGRHDRWYVVRDLGSALGETGRVSPRGNDPVLYERSTFITGVRDGVVEFANGGRQAVFDDRITVGDVEWAAQLLSRLNDTQWRDAFRAANYPPTVADRFLRKIHANIAQALSLRGTH